jgi:hypothetical protein
MPLLLCGCTGAIDYDSKECGAPATQEDLLCDHCRTLRCWERPVSEMGDPTMCIRLGCPEHTIPRT